MKQATRDRQGRKLAASGSIPRIVAGGMKRQAEESAGRSGELHAERLRAARERLSEAEAAVRDDSVIRISLPDTAVPPGRTVLTVSGLGGGAWHPARTAESEVTPASVSTLIVRGPERIALLGPNGAGKTTLLRAISGQVPLPGVTVRPGVITGYLPQRLDILDDQMSIVDNVRAAAPAATVNAVRASLARFLFRGKRADVLAGTLSGGERFRAVLATLLLAEPAPQLLLLDEPTNSLDMASVRQLTQALDDYQGALLIASHDVHFLRSAGITRWLGLDRDGDLTETDPL
jgi:ATPase subunit of ABC transporter with duplicated ATPase domains